MTFGIGVIGLGMRGMDHVNNILTERSDTVITAVCDLYEDRMQAAADVCLEKKGWSVASESDYRRLIERKDVDVVCIFSAWENHVPAALYAMECGKQVCMEVGGAYSVDDCFALVNAYERTGIHCMMLENCCYDRNELMALRMARAGMFGKIVHMEGGYCHDLRDEICRGEELRHYRLRNYKSRCAENYPTHELGPIAKVLGINRGNRMVSLTSVASGAFGLNEYASRTDGIDPELKDYPFAQGDIVKTQILCEGGELITLTLDTTLPRNYTRNFTVRGTKGLFSDLVEGIFLDDGSFDHFSKDFYGNIEKYRPDWEHPIWQKFLSDGVRGSHGGMDWLLFEAYFESLKNTDVPPIDTYDTAAWMAITPLSEMSIRNGGAPVEIPDFTDGKWMSRTDINNGFYSLDK